MVHNWYIGYFKSGKRKGLGVEILSNGVVYCGGWMDSKKHGFGIEINEEGVLRSV